MHYTTLVIFFACQCTPKPQTHTTKKLNLFHPDYNQRQCMQDMEGEDLYSKLAGTVYFNHYLNAPGVMHEYIYKELHELIEEPRNINFCDNVSDEQNKHKK